MTKNVVRVALNGYDALKDTDPSHFSLFTDQDNVLIKEKSRGSGAIASGNTAVIVHNLGYIPFFLVYCEISTNRFQAVNTFDPNSGVWRAYADTTNLYVRNVSSSTKRYRFYIFYDNVT